MKKTSIAAVASLIMLAISGCSAPASTQTGGGSSSSKPAAATAQAVVTPGTTADAIAEGWLAGNAKPSFKDGHSNKTDVVANGPIVATPGGTSVPIALRNNTSTPVTSIEVTGAAMDASGKILGSGQSQGFNPQVVQPGGVALGFVYFDPNTKIPADAKIEFTVASKPLEGSSYFVDLKVDQANASGGSITGKATNASKDKLNGPYSVHVTCFDKGGELLSSVGGFASPSADLDAGQSVTFQVPLYDKPCPTFLLGVSGYGPLG